jgi:hypothetical protein
MGFMIFQLMDHIYNSPIKDLHFVMNPSIALEVQSFFSVPTLHESNLTIAYGNLSKELQYWVKPQSTTWFFKFVFIEYDDN